MDHLKASFERELKNKLQEKTKGAQSEETVLLKAFKYFDLNDNGQVEPDEFAKAIEKIGIQIPTQRDLDTLFSLYDADGSGGISYKEFSQALFNKPVSGQGMSAGPTGSAASRNPEQLAEALKDKLATRGARGIIGLQKQFKIMDDDNSKSLDKNEFNKALTDYKLGFTPAENGALFDYFDVDASGTISYDEFIRAVRGPMNMARKRVVAQAFKKLDADGNGWIDINDIRGVYKANKHPDVISGKKTEDQILNEFLSTFELAHSMRSGEAPNYVVTKEEFEEYYNNVSCSIDDDLYFAAMMNSAWKLDQQPGQSATKSGWSNAKPRAAQDNNIFNRPDPTAKKADDADLALNASEQQLKDHIRARIAARGARGLMGIAKKFKIADDNGNGLLDKEEFAKAMHDFRMGLSAKQVTAAFKMFDRDGSGEITYDEFLRSIRGPLNKVRADICMKAFDIMDIDKSGDLDINDIRQKYNAKQHPDVKAGKKTEDEILMEFLETFEQHFTSMPGNEDARDGHIDKKEWLEYYSNVSMSIDRDDYFILMMTNAWNLDNKVSKKAWGGEV